ncbi:MAG: tetratricopeptide repeat protein, partial [Bacteroidetes bacterium]|nr:tetratricopeptide repeat protein [Bacteroidota bacterium]
YEQALEAYKNTHKWEGPSAETYCCIGNAYEKLKQYEQAIKYYQKATKADVSFDRAWFGIGYCLCQQNRHFEAVYFYTKSLKYDAENGTYWLALADAEYRAGNLMSSFEAFQAASQYDGNNPTVWMEWSYVYFDLKEFDKAFVIIKAGMDELPDNAEMLYRATVYLISAGKYKEAFNFLENALILDFDKHTVLFDFFKKPEVQKALYKIIDQYRN